MIEAPRYEAAAPWELRLEGTNPDVPAVAVNSRGDVHILTRSPHPVLVFDQRGRFLRSWGEGIFTTTHGMTIGPEGNLLDPGPASCRQSVLSYPTLANEKPAKLFSLDEGGDL